MAAVLLGFAVAATPAYAMASPFTPHNDAAQQVTKVTATGLDDPVKKGIAMKLVSSAENSSLDWKAQYKYIEDIDDGRGYTAGIIGFCSGTGDMLDLVKLYKARKPGNILEKFLPALRKVNGSDSHDGLGSSFEKAWATAAGDADFRKAQDDE